MTADRITFSPRGHVASTSLIRTFVPAYCDPQRVPKGRFGAAAVGVAPSSRPAAAGRTRQPLWKTQFFSLRRRKWLLAVRAGGTIPAGQSQSTIVGTRKELRDGQKKTHQRDVVQDRSQGTAEAVSEPTHGGCCRQTGPSHGGGQEESLSDGSQENQELHEVPRESVAGRSSPATMQQHDVASLT